MANLPGSLDYLYNSGIIDHIPYEAYEMTPLTYANTAQMNGSQYLQAAQKGLLYNTYTCPDTFVRRNTNTTNEYSVYNRSFKDGDGYSRDADLEVMANGEDGKRYRKAITNAASRAKETVSNSPNWVKGLLASGILITTLCALLTKGKAKVKCKK